MHIELKLGRFQVKKMKGSIPAGIGENQQSVTDEPVEFRNNRLKLKTSGGLPIILEESMEEYASNEQSKIGRCQHVTSWI